MTKRQMALTRELVARVHRVVEDAGPLPGPLHSDADYDQAVRNVLTSHARGEDAWLFAYGSLIWKPEVEHLDERPAIAYGWHRSFCYRVMRFRGTLDRPGLMMALDRGGQCQGVLYRLPADTLASQLGKLFRREFTIKPPNLLPRWIRVATPQGPLHAISFVMNRHAGAYVGRMSPEQAAAGIAGGCGHWGSCAEYLFNTVMHLEQRGIHDRNLWRLQQLVAERIASGNHHP